MRVEDENVWWVPRDVLCNTLPIDCTLCGTGVSVTIHVQTEFFSKVVSVEVEMACEAVLTVITKKVLVLSREKDTHWTTRLASFSELLVSRVVALRRSKTAKAVDSRFAINW